MRAASPVAGEETAANPCQTVLHDATRFKPTRGLPAQPVDLHKDRSAIFKPISVGMGDQGPNAHLCSQSEALPEIHRASLDRGSGVRGNRTSGAAPSRQGQAAAWL